MKVLLRPAHNFIEFSLNKIKILCLLDATNDTDAYFKGFNCLKPSLFWADIGEIG